jgi:hypothetical protein
MKQDSSTQRRRLAAPRGSFEGQRWLAAEEADEAERLAVENSKSPRARDLARLGAYGSKAFQAAVGLTALSRATIADGSDNENTAADFVGHYVRLVEYNKRTSALESIELWRAWPKNPGTTFSWKAGDSALHVAIIFARMILAATEHARLQALRGLDLDALPVTPEPDQRLVSWLDATVTELREHTLPPMPTWPMWEIHRDSGALLCKFGFEWESATGEDPVIAMANPLSIDSIIGRFQTAAAEFASVRVWLVVTKGHHIPPSLPATITGGPICMYGALPAITINASASEGGPYEASGILLYRGDGLQAIEACKRLSAEAGAWLVANRLISDAPSGLSPAMIWWLTVHCKLASGHQHSFENTTFWLHDPLLDSLQTLARIRDQVPKMSPSIDQPSARKVRRSRRGAPSTAARDAEYLAEFERGEYKSQAAFARSKKMEPSAMRHLLRRANAARRSTKSKRR